MEAKAEYVGPTVGSWLATGIYHRCKSVLHISNQISINNASDEFDSMEDPVEQRVKLAWNQMHDVEIRGSEKWFTLVD